MSNEFNFLGMDFDDIHRKTVDAKVGASRAARLTSENALIAASRFSGGQACSNGEGQGESRNFPAEPCREGSFNICYWVRVDGMDAQWVVRFPKPIADDNFIRMKLRSEVATLQFLHQNTRVPVPKLIGYGDGDDTLPPFLIVENVDGMRLTLLWGIDLQLSIVNKILRSLAEIQHELLSHSFDRIGMLDIPTGNHDPAIIGPFSLDQLEHCRDGVSPILHPPLKSVSQYYDHKLEIWNHRLRKQRNAVDSRSDAIRKFINAEIVQKFLTGCGRPVQENGPFYLVHPDLHGHNVIIQPGKWTVKAIIDWEGACILPFASAFSPPKCLYNIKPADLLPTSTDYQRFQEHLKLYAHQFSRVAEELRNTEEHRNTRDLQVADRFERSMRTCVNTKLFFTWAIDDVRDLDQLVWQHIAPTLYVELKEEFDALLTQQPNGQRDETSPGGSIKTLLSNFIDKLYCTRHDKDTIEVWVQEKLGDLDVYEEMLRSGDRPEGIPNS
jgi:hypothetical protein